MALVLFCILVLMVLNFLANHELLKKVLLLSLLASLTALFLAALATLLLIVLYLEWSILDFQEVRALPCLVLLFYALIVL